MTRRSVSRRPAAGRKNRTGLYLVGAAVLAAAAVAGAVIVAAGGDDGGVAAATVNGTEIGGGAFEAELDMLADNTLLNQGGNVRPDGAAEVKPEIASGWLTALIYDALLTEEFKRRELEVTPADRTAASAQLETQFGNKAVIDRFPTRFRELLGERNSRAAAVRAKVAPVDDSEAARRAYYDGHQADFVKVCASHLLVDTEAAASAALGRVRGGEDFAKVAGDVSKDTGSAQKGGDLGCNSAGIFVDEFAAAAAAAQLNVPTEPVETTFGYHVIVVRERPASSFEDAKADVEAALDAEAQGEFEKFLAGLAEKAEVEVDLRYGTFEIPGGDQAPQVVPPKKK